MANDIGRDRSALSPRNTGPKVPSSHHSSRALFVIAAFFFPVVGVNGMTRTRQSLGFRLVARREYRSMHLLLDQRYRFSAVFDGGVYEQRVNYSSVLSGTLTLFSPAERHANESYLLSSSM